MILQNNENKSDIQVNLSAFKYKARKTQHYVPPK